MPNSNPQAILIANSKIRPMADVLAGMFNMLKSAQIEYVAEGWGALFPADNEIIVDGSAEDGRTPITNNDVRNLILVHAAAILSALEANANAGRDLAFKIAPNPRV
jgi:hypothetical protein